MGKNSLGTFRNGNNTYAFIWEKQEGLKIIDALFSPQLLNNKGQIIGWRKGRICLWDSVLGFQAIDLDNVSSLNDKGQVLGTKKITENTDSLDEQTVENFFQETHDLIKPLLSYQ